MICMVPADLPNWNAWMMVAFTPNLPIRVELEIYVDHVECSRSSRRWITPVYRKIALSHTRYGPAISIYARGRAF